MPDTSIVVTITDRYSDSLKKMSSTTKSFSKDVDGLEDTLSHLTKNKAELKIELTKAKQQLKEAENRFKSTGSEVDRLTYLFANVQVDNLTRNLKAVTNSLSETEKQISKLENKAGGSGGFFGAIAGLKESGAMSRLGQMASQAVGQMGSAFASSMWGEDSASTIGSTLGGVASGASIGMMFGPWGATIGAVVGGLSGLFSGLTETFEKRDDFFKNYYNEEIEARKGEQEEAMEAGSTTAGGREQDQIAFAKRLGGDEAAREYLDRVKAMSSSTNYSYDQITGYSKQLLNTYSTDETLDVLKTLSDATAGLSLSESDVSIWISGLSRMRTTNKATMEYLNFFSERGLDVYDALAKGLKVDKTKIAEMVSQGKISGNKAAEILLAYMDEQYGGLSQELMTTYVAMKDNLDDVTANVEAGYGEGYNEERKSGLGAKSESLDGKLGDRLTEINEILGFKQGYVENVQDNYQLDIMEAVFTGDKTLREGVTFDETTAGWVEDYKAQYRSALAQYNAAAERGDRQGMFEAATKIENIKLSVETMASEAFKLSDTNQTLITAETNLTTETRNLTAAFNAWAAEYGLQQEQDKGLGAAEFQDYSEVDPSYGGFGGTSTTVFNPVTGEVYAENSNAWGLDRVPYDNYPTLLHEGERVLTAQQAREADSGQIRLVISGNEFHIREDADIDRVAEALLQKLQLASMRG